MASIDYYNNSDLHGNYQYVTMEELVNNYLMSRDEDAYDFGTPRFKVLHQCRRAFQELYYDVVKEVRAIALELSPSLQITLPPDYVNYVRISWLDSYGQLHPLAVDNRMSIADEYLQDNNYELLFDNDGCVLQGTSQPKPIEPISPDTDIIGDPTSLYYSYTFCGGGGGNFQPNVDASRIFTNGRFRIDKNRGIIQFGSEIEGREIVIEYISDGLYVGCEGLPATDLRIHKFAEDAVYNFIYHELIKQRRNVPYNEKIRSRKEKYNSIRITKRRINTLRKDEILQYFRASSKWIK